MTKTMHELQFFLGFDTNDVLQYSHVISFSYYHFLFKFSFSLFSTHFFTLVNLLILFTVVIATCGFVLLISGSIKVLLTRLLFMEVTLLEHY